MAEFSGRITDVTYMDTACTFVRVLYEADDGAILTYQIPVDPNHPDFQEIEAEGWDDIAIGEATKKYAKNRANGFAAEVLTIAKNAGLIDVKDREDKPEAEPVKPKVQLEAEAIFEIVLAEETSAEDLFKFKLAAFDLPFVVDCSDREMKKALRKAETFIEVINLVHQIKNA